MESYSMDPVQGRKDHISQENLNPNDDQSKRKGTKRIIYRFFHYTTINGLQRLASSGTILGRLFWILVLLGAGGMFSRDIYTLIQQFFERPISVVSRVEYFRAMRFPAVTVCNVNPIRKSAYQFSTQLKQKLEERDNDTCFREAQRRKDSKCDAENDEIEQFENEIDHILSSIDVEDLVKSGHQRRDFIVSCRFNGRRCSSEKYWTRFWDPQYGNCFAFNSHLGGSNVNRTLFRAKKPGSAYGLKLVLNIELDEYIPQLTADAGVKVSITEPGEMPFPIYNSLSLAPGFQNEIALKRIQIKRLDRFKNGSCRTNGQLDARNPYRLTFGAEYSIQACLQYCYALSQINQCGCAEYSYFGATPLGKICDENDEIVDECLDNWKSSDGPCEKTCPDLCSETLYESSLTFTQWPYPKSVESVLESLGFNYSDYNNSVNLVRECSSQATTSRSISHNPQSVPRSTGKRGNFLTTNIFYQRFRENQIEESLNYETANLLADIGGQIGLWAGLSIISMCELLELFALVFRDFFERERR